MQRHDFSVDLDAPLADVWEVFWYREPDRPQPRDVKTRIEILHPGDEVGNGLVRHCYFPVPKWLLSGGVGQSWEWLTEVKLHAPVDASKFAYPRTGADLVRQAEPGPPVQGAG